MMQVDYYGTSKFWNIVTGGLNAQSLHHLFPSVHNSHYPYLYHEYKRICANHGVKVQEFTFLDVFVSYLRCIHDLATYP